MFAPVPILSSGVNKLPAWHPLTTSPVFHRPASGVDIGPSGRNGDACSGYDTAAIRAHRRVGELVRLRWAVRGVLTFGLAASIAANVLHARPDLTSQMISAWPPLSLLLTVELVSRVPVHRWWRATIRVLATSSVAGIAAWVSYGHMVEVARRFGETGQTPYLLPVSVDGLIIVASICLVELTARVRDAEAGQPSQESRNGTAGGDDSARAAAGRTGTDPSDSAAGKPASAIELLVDAGQWTAANNLFRARTDNGRLWQNLPAAGLGQRAATAFVGTPGRRQACATHLTSAGLRSYLNDLGFFANEAGDPATAAEYLSAAIDQERADDDPLNLSIGLQNWSECLASLGRVRESADAAADALTHATASTVQTEITDSHSYRGWAAHLAGDTIAAEEQFRLANHPSHAPFRSVQRVRWGWFLHNTGRTGPARRETEAYLAISQRNGWSDQVGYCRVLLARLDLTAGNLAAAKSHVDAAMATFRAGDYLVELAAALVVVGEAARRTGHLDAADEALGEAVNVAGPRGLTPSHTAALAQRARVHADRYTTTHDPAQLWRGRDAAEAAQRLAAGPHPLPWAELSAYRAHAYLDQAERVDRGWAERADTLHGHLVPVGLDPDPLTTVEAQVARDRKPPAPSPTPAVPRQNQRRGWSLFRRR
jgi:tetratricopeptide (TPR) repeat protein